MIGLVVRQVHLQQVQTLVDLVDQPQPGHQPMHRSDPTKTPGVNVAPDLIRHLLGPRHRPRPRPPPPSHPVRGGPPPPPTSHVPPTLIMLYLLHHKGPLSPDSAPNRSPSKIGPLPTKDPTTRLLEG